MQLTMETIRPKKAHQSGSTNLFLFSHSLLGEIALNKLEDSNNRMLMDRSVLKTPDCKISRYIFHNNLRIMTPLFHRYGPAGG